MDNKTQIKPSDIGYKTSLIMQVIACSDSFNDLGFSFSQDGYRRKLNKVKSTVSTLRMMLFPYLDKEFRDAEERIKSGVLDKNELVEKGHSTDEAERIVSQSHADAMLNEQERRFELLMKLLARKGLLLEEETEDYA